MKKITTALTVVILFCAAAAMGQQVPRENVVLEIGTGTWCQYCPGSAMGAEELIENGFDVAVIEYHSGDEYQTTQSQARVNYYNITGFPTAFFDGGLPVVGGSTTESMYPSYYPRVNQRMAVATSFAMTLEGTHSCFEDYTANITIEKVAAYSGTNLVLHAVVTESHIEDSWFGMDEVSYVCRMMYPNQYGTPISFTSGTTQTVELDFTPNSAWVVENMEMVVFLQDNNSMEILQAAKMSLLDFEPVYNLDASVNSIIGLPEFDCSGSIAPTITIRNTGNSVLNSVDINYSMNGGAVMTQPWAGTLEYLQSTEITLPAIDFELEETNELAIYTSNPNGSPDECDGNDEMTAMIEQAMFVANTVKLLIRTDAHPEETTWEVLNSSGEMLYQGGPYEQSGQMINETFELAAEDCFTFNIYDSGGDGFLAPGFYLLYHGSSSVISQGITFGPYKYVDFNTSDPVGIDDGPMASQVQVYPNPASDIVHISFPVEGSVPVSIDIFSLTGQKVQSMEFGNMLAGVHTAEMNMASIPAGIYFYTIRSGSGSHTGKMVINR